ncbi:HNH endonuclease signature motif containing protein, partial [Microbacterium foliorum]
EDPFNSDPRCVLDGRTSAQKRHDALAMVLTIAARHNDMPSLGGAAPVLVVNVDAADLASHTTHAAQGSSFGNTAQTASGNGGWATITGSGAHVPLSVAAQIGCAGTIQRVEFDAGRIIAITTTDRVFTVHQRRAIIARDRECLIPGCHVSASWCEIHHVTEHAKAGPTHTDNGVPLCWWHHRSLGKSGWEIRMNDGVPQVRGPAWWDPDRRWRTPRLSAARRRIPSRLARTG